MVVALRHKTLRQPEIPSVEALPEYRPRQPESTVLHGVVRDHLETFLADAAGQGGAVPEMVERELRDFLSCGSLARGFARVRCTECGTERLVAFSCKGRGFCPSCMGRRMTELSAHLVDDVIPRVPVRQWVLSLPVPLRYVLAWDHDLCLGRPRRLPPRVVGRPAASGWPRRARRTVRWRQLGLGWSAVARVAGEGGPTKLDNGNVALALPFCIVIVLMIVSLVMVLRRETLLAARRD